MLGKAKEKRNGEYLVLANVTILVRDFAISPLETVQEKFDVTLRDEYK